MIVKKTDGHISPRYIITPEFNLGRRLAQIYAERIENSACSAFIRVLFFLKNELTRETLISG